MRQIAVSVELFAKIWALRQAGEETENAILTRLIADGTPRKLENYSGSEAARGFRDLRHHVIFPEGFEIFSKLKGRDVRALANGGAWLCGDQVYGSLNALSRGVGGRTENAWVSWFFLDADGRRQPISALRDPAAVARRARPAKAEMESPMSEDEVWLNDVKAGLSTLEDGRGLLADIYEAVETSRRGAGRPWPADAEALVRRTLEDSEGLFSMPYGAGAGFWALR